MSGRQAFYCEKSGVVIVGVSLCPDFLLGQVGFLVYPGNGNFLMLTREDEASWKALVMRWLRSMPEIR